MAGKQLLLVHPNIEIKGVVQKILNEIRSENHEIAPLCWASTQEEAEENYLNLQSYDLVIIYLYLPKTREVVQEPSEQTGLRLALKHHDRTSNESIILIYPYQNETLLTVCEQLQLPLVLEGTNFEIQLKDEILACLDSTHEVESEQRFDLEIELDLDTPARCHWQLRGINCAVNADGWLSVDTNVLSKLVQKSTEELTALIEMEKVRATNDHVWQRVLQEIGNQLTEQIFSNNLELLKKFNQLIGRVGSIENARICFRVDEKSYPIALEALTEKDEEFWMLQAPIFRRLRLRNSSTLIASQRYALFGSQKNSKSAINCLIIQANATGSVQGLENVHLQKLENVDTEAQWLEKYLLEHKEEFHIGDVCRLSIDSIPAEGSFKDVVKQILLEENWHIIHYAGHSLYDQESQKGYLFFPGKRSGNIEERLAQPLLIEDFAARTAKTQFVYLSSCHSSEEDFVFRLAEKDVPAVLGFRWDIEDTKAEQFTEFFYTCLFEQESLEYAFLEARKRMHDDNGNRYDPVWASPMLAIQMFD